MDDRSRHPALSIDHLTHNADLCQKFHVNRQNLEFTDFTIVVEGATLPCHRMVLAAGSPYFDAALSNDMVERQRGTVTLEGVTSCAMRLILDYMYTGRLTVDYCHIEDVLHAADYLQIPAIKHWCERYVVNELNADNCLGWLRVGTVYNLGFLVERARETIYKSIHRVVESSEFVRLSLAEILDYFSYENFKVRNEDLLLQACVDWIRYDKENRLKKAGDLLKCTNPAKCSDGFLKRLAEENPDIISHEVRQIIGNVMFERCIRQDSSRSGENNCIILIGGCSNHDGIHKHFKPRICDNKHQWRKLTPPPKYRIYASVCAVDDCLLLSGGVDDGVESRESYLYRVKYDVWNRVADMPGERCKHSSLAFGKTAYIFGGRRGEATVPAFDVDKNEWTAVSPMPRAPGTSPVVVKNGIRAYVISSTSGVNEPAVPNHGFYMHVYDPVKDTWTRGPSPPGTVNHAYGSAAVSYKDSIYLVGGESKLCLAYDTRARSWTNLTPPPRVHQFGATVLIDGNIRIYGGSKGRTDHAAQYDIDRDQWKILSDVAFGLNVTISRTSAFLTTSPRRN